MCDELDTAASAFVSCAGPGDLGGQENGARIAALARAGEVLVSSTVRDLVAGSGLRFTDHGIHTLKGVPDQWHIFAANAQ
jgi:hypothetical protein